MSLNRKLEDWQAAGLIDAQAVAAIRAHEARESRPVALWAAIGLGLLALALGIVLIVAAGWDRIPAAIKLAGNLVLVIAAAQTVFRAQRGSWLAEGALVVLAALVLAGLALHAQVWQLTGPLWQLLGWWALLMSPAILLAGSTRLTAYLWAAMLAALALSFALDSAAPAYMKGWPPALLPFLLYLSATPKGAPPPKFRDGVREAGLALTLGAASLAQLAWSMPVSSHDAVQVLSHSVWTLVIATVTFFIVREDRTVVRTALAASAIAVLLVLIPHSDSLLPRLVGALSFLAMWGAIAMAADRDGWTTLFGIAIAAIALRILIVYFELFGGLATTGFGLVGGGVLLILLAVGWSRVVRKART